MAWVRIHLRCEPAAPGHEIATAWLADAGCSMFEEAADGLHAFAKKEELDEGLADVIKEDLIPLGLKSWLLSEVEEENWNAQWESDYPEVEVGRVVRVSAPFHGRTDPDDFAHQITIQPRMAFGTGHHETTRGLLAEMAKMDWEDRCVLDMGCGSGVLGIYAAMRGARDVVFVDIDPWSVRNTEENLGLNQLAESGFEVREGGAQVLTTKDTARFDVVLANINRNILIEDMAAYVATLKSPGVLMLSGFLHPDLAPLERAAQKHGLSRSSLREEAQWRILSLVC